MYYPLEESELNSLQCRDVPQMRQETLPEAWTGAQFNPTRDGFTRTENAIVKKKKKSDNSHLQVSHSKKEPIKPASSIWQRHLPHNIQAKSWCEAAERKLMSWLPKILWFLFLERCIQWPLMLLGACTPRLPACLLESPGKKDQAPFFQ